MSTDDEYADRLREVLSAEAEAVVPAGDGLARIRERTARRGARMRWIRPLAVVGGAAVVAAGVVIGISLSNDDPRLHQDPTPLGSSSNTPSPTATSMTDVPGPFSLSVGLPLWPYADGSSAAADTSPASWHLDPAATALHFTTDHLRFTDDNLVLSTTKSADGLQAWVSIGYHTEGSRTATAAVVHVVRWSADGPWEVVGTKDSTFSLTKPSYGANASSPLTAGGQIQGVDESIRVAVHDPSSSTPLGVACCTGAGTGSWSAKVSYQPSSASVLTVVASTGGHLIEHERWALTGVRNGSAASPSTAPSSFVAVSQQRVGVFRTSDGARLRWLTTLRPGGGASHPRHIGSSVYFLESTGNCAGRLMRVPFAGGSERSVYSQTGSTIDGYSVSADGKLAMTLGRCSDHSQKLFVLDPATGRSHSSSWAAEPPSIEGDPAWAVDNTHLAIAYRTGNLVGVDVINAFTFPTAHAYDYASNSSHPCGDGSSQGMPQELGYSGSTLFAVFQSGDVSNVVTCGGAATHPVFKASAVADRFSVDSKGNVILCGVTGLADGHIIFWSGGKSRDLHTSDISQAVW
jgi:hypothetical protein